MHIICDVIVSEITGDALNDVHRQEAHNGCETERQNNNKHARFKTQQE